MAFEQEAQDLLNTMATFTGEDPLNCPIAASCSLVALDMILAGANPTKPDLYVQYYMNIRNVIAPPIIEPPIDYPPIEL